MRDELDTESTGLESDDWTLRECRCSWVVVGFDNIKMVREVRMTVEKGNGSQWMGETSGQVVAV